MSNRSQFYVHADGRFDYLAWPGCSGTHVHATGTVRRHGRKLLLLVERHPADRVQYRLEALPDTPGDSVWVEIELDAEIATVADHTPWSCRLSGYREVVRLLPGAALRLALARQTDTCRIHIGFPGIEIAVVPDRCQRLVISALPPNDACFIQPGTSLTFFLAGRRAPGRRGAGGRLEFSRVRESVSDWLQ